MTLAGRSTNSGEWRRRYENARVALSDLSAVRAERGRLADAARANAPALTIMVGGELLRAAHHVGVFMGSFNPLTIAHTGAADVARAALGLDTLVWGMAVTSVNKERVERAAVVDRLVQVEAYVRSAAPGDAVAIFQSGLYMGQAEAVRALPAPAADLWFLIGFDKAAQIFDPRYYMDRDVALRALFAATRLAVMPRDADSQEALGSLLGRAENQEYAHRVAFVNMPPELAAVSSSVARELLARAGNPPRVDPELAADLLAPEGAALALVTGAYSPPARSPDGRLVDLYADHTAALAADPDDALRAADAIPQLPSTQSPPARPN